MGGAPRTTAPYHTEEESRMLTRPITDADGATNELFVTVGNFWNRFMTARWRLTATLHGYAGVHVSPHEAARPAHHSQHPHHSMAPVCACVHYTCCPHPTRTWLLEDGLVNRTQSDAIDALAGLAQSPAELEHDPLHGYLLRSAAGTPTGNQVT